MVEKRKNNKKWRWIGGAVIVLLVIIIIVVGLNKLNDSDKNKDNETTSIEENNVERSEQVEGQSGDDFAEKEVERKKVVQYEGEDPNENAELTGVISYAGVADGVLRIRVAIDQYVSSGTCELALIRNGSIVHQSSAGVIPDVSTATCEGFDVPMSGLGSGKLQIEVKLVASEKTGLIQGEVEL